MSRVFLKSYFFLTLLTSLYVLSIGFLFSKFYPFEYIKHPLFFSELLGKPVTIPTVVIYIIGLLNIFLVWYLSKFIFKGQLNQVFVIIFSTSPWYLYTVLSGSVYIYLMFLILVSSLGIIFLMKKREKGMLLFLVGLTLGIYSSIFFLIILPVHLILLKTLHILPSNKIKHLFFMFLILCLPLGFFSFNNIVGFKNVANYETNLFKNSTIITSVNQLQGESKKYGFSYLSKISENRYLYISKYLLLKFIKNTSPQSFFTADLKLLNFSFSPPIFFSFLIPYTIGLFYVITINKLRRYLIISSIFILPSYLSKDIVNLSRLILFLPAIVFIVTFGISKMTESKNRLLKVLLIFTIFLSFFQFVVTVFDIGLREYPRLIRYTDGKADFGKDE